MLTDLDSAGSPGWRRYDVCVCGTGPAGLTVARTLAAAGKSVLLLEAGGLALTEASQDIYAGEETGLKTWNAIRNCRLRYFGGTSNHWTGLCGLFAESEFDEQRYHGLPGWPIARKELLQELPEAARILDLPAAEFTPRPWKVRSSTPLQHVRFQQSPPTRFGTKYRDEVSQSGRLHVVLNANVVGVRLQSASAALPEVEHLQVRNYRGDSFRVSAKRYVLALGAIENARLLLNSTSQLAEGIGNHSDFVGRCFMEHFNVGMGRFLIKRPEAFDADGDLHLTPDDAFMRAQRIGGGVLSLDGNASIPEYGRTAALKGLVRGGVCASDTLRDYARRFQNFSCPGDGVISSMIEQTPDPESRVRLTQDSDAFGLRRAHLNWTMNDLDRRTIRLLGQTLAEQMARQDVGRVQLSEFMLDTRLPIDLINHCHQMGTTRMSRDPRHGVVDGHCRVHSVGNLYLAGSSVFPTGGGINPTLTVVMLASRLGKHLAVQA